MAQTRKLVSKPKLLGKNWVMAVDPFSDLDMKPLIQLVKPLAESSGAQLHAIYIMAPAALNWTGDFSGPWRKKYVPIAEAKLKEFFAGTGIPTSVVNCKDSGQSAVVKSLLGHAKKMKADRLVISTHARKGLERLTMGSFAESVIVASKVPVLVVNPSQRLPKVVRKILVPTDLSKKNAKFVTEVAAYAKRLGAEVVLFHKQPDPLDPIVQQGVYSLGGGWVSVQNFMEEESTERNRQIAKIEGELRRKDINVSHVYDTSPAGLIESINKAASDSGADMISVMTSSGKWAAGILGSVARGLVRNAHRPLLVQR